MAQDRVRNSGFFFIHSARWMTATEGTGTLWSASQFYPGPARFPPKIRNCCQIPDLLTSLIHGDDPSILLLPARRSKSMHRSLPQWRSVLISMLMLPIGVGSIASPSQLRPYPNSSSRIDPTNGFAMPLWLLLERRVPG